ncbi:hypothetical protein ACEWY4_027413 [Coilia grayii]|uniref:CCHC-type domain-containing protein n=1 Tax=Coilia grayii TaxID=363190 RepID=A0ABD1IRY8_9TELE
MEGFEHLTRRHAVKLASNASVEVCSLAVGNKVGHENVVSAARMNNAVVIFLSSVALANDLVESGVDIDGVFTPVLPLSTPSKKVILSNIPPFIKDEVLCKILGRYGKIVSSVKKIPISSKSPLLKHVVSFRRYVYMVLKDNGDELNLTLNVKVDNFNYVVYATTGTMTCFKCGKMGHLIRGCPEQQGNSDSKNDNSDKPNENTVDKEGLAVESGAPSASETAHSSASGGEVSAEAPCETAEDEFTRSPTDSVTTDNLASTDENAMEAEEGNFKMPKNVKRRRQQANRHAKKQVVTSDLANDESESECSDHSIDYSLRNSGFSPCSYSVDDIKAFLEKTKNRRNIRIDDFFPDVEQFCEKTRSFLGEGCFTEQEGYRLKKMLTKLNVVLNGTEDNVKT